MARVGLLGGTFNPPHIGHLVCADQALAQLELDVVRLLPARLPPHKEVPADPGPEVRLALCRAAVAGSPRLAVCDLEVRRPGPSWTVDTLRVLDADAPGDQLTFIVGGDMARSLPTWREPETILALAELAVAEREDIRRREIAQALEALPAAQERVRFFEMPRLDVSSSWLRAQVAAGRPIRHLVPDAVAELIESRGLYRAGEGGWA